MANQHNFDTLPFPNVDENKILDKNNNHYNSNFLLSTHYDTLADIDPDVNNTLPNELRNQCKSYDTSFEFNKEIGDHNNISLLHANICSSANKIKDFMYYIDNLNTTFHVIGLSETWATQFNSDLMDISGYSHEMCFRTNSKKGGGVSIYVHNDIHYKRREDLSLPSKLYESVFIEIDKSIFCTNRNVIIGEIYNPPSSKLKCFNTNLEKLNK